MDFGLNLNHGKGFKLPFFLYWIFLSPDLVSRKKEILHYKLSLCIEKLIHQLKYSLPQIFFTFLTINNVQTNSVQESQLWSGLYDSFGVQVQGQSTLMY